jgi:hypothetical protein
MNLTRYKLDAARLYSGLATFVATGALTTITQVYAQKYFLLVAGISGLILLLHASPAERTPLAILQDGIAVLKGLLPVLGQSERAQLSQIIAGATVAEPLLPIAFSQGAALGQSISTAEALGGAAGQQILMSSGETAPAVPSTVSVTIPTATPGQ